MLHKYAIWVAIVLTSIAFAAAGIAKLMGVPMVHESFANLGLPGWFGYVIGGDGAWEGCHLDRRVAFGVEPVRNQSPVFGQRFDRVTDE